MRIIHFIYDHTGNPWVGGGGAVRVREIYDRLSAAHEITVVCGKYPGAEDYTQDGVNYRFVGSARDNYVVSTLAYALRASFLLGDSARSSDILIEDFAPYNPLWAGRVRRYVPVVLQLQNYLGSEILHKYGPLGMPSWFIERTYPRRFDNFIIMVDALRHRYGIKGNVQTISNGIHPELFNIQGGSPDGHLLFMGRMDIHQKGLDLLARAMAGVQRKLIIAGQGRTSDMRRCKEMFAGYKHVEFAGHLEGQDKLDAISGASLLVLPSRYEGQGIVVLEAAAAGVPCVVSDIPELGYAVEGGFGLAFRHGDASALGSAINRLLDDSGLSRKMSESASRYAETLTWDNMAAKYDVFLKSTRAAWESK